MAILRCGKVTTPHKSSASILLTRLDGNPLRIPIKDIIYWQEAQMSNSLGKIVCIHYDLYATAVKETFEAINEEINGKAVQP